MERQHIVVFSGIAAVIAILVPLSFYYNSLPKQDQDFSFTVSVGRDVYVRYSPAIIDLIQDLPTKNNLTLVSSSELKNTALGGSGGGEFRYKDVQIFYTQEGRLENETDDTFKTIEYRYDPDRGTNVTYAYIDVDYRTVGEDNGLIATFEQLSRTKAGDIYVIETLLNGESINVEKVKIVP